MILFLDICIIIIIYIIIILILTGFVSLCERKILAIIQIRIGPALLLFGLFTPITDGIKLFIKFVNFIISFDIFYFIISTIILCSLIFIGWFFFPIGFIILIDNSFSIIFLLCIHILGNMFGIFFVGCFLFSSCFVYLATMRTLFFCILSESLMFLLFCTIYILDVFSLFGIKDICINQLYINNCFLLSAFFIGIFWISLLLDGLKLPFDYMECESELVAGLITEMSGIFFVIYSVFEINHLLLTTLLFASLCFGGLFICIKSILILIIFFLLPRSIGFRLKITTAQLFILLFLFFLCFFFFSWLTFTKIISILF